MTNGNVLGFLAAPDREDSLRAVSLALLRVLSNPENTRKKVAKALECSTDTIAGAIAEESLLSFDSIARLGYFFPDEFALVAELWGRATDEPTVEDRVARIERELDAIRREAA